MNGKGARTIQFAVMLCALMVLASCRRSTESHRDAPLSTAALEQALRLAWKDKDVEAIRVLYYTNGMTEEAVTDILEMFGEAMQADLTAIQFGLLTDEHMCFGWGRDSRERMNLDRSGTVAFETDNGELEVFYGEKSGLHFLCHMVEEPLPPGFPPLSSIAISVETDPIDATVKGEYVTVIMGEEEKSKLIRGQEVFFAHDLLSLDAMRAGTVAGVHGSSGMLRVRITIDGEVVFHGEDTDPQKRISYRKRDKKPDASDGK